MKLQLKKATTSYSTYVFIQDSSSTTGAGLTGLVFNSASLSASYVRPLAVRTAITLATQTVTGAYSSGGFVEVDSTNMPGVYRVDLPDAALATSVDSVLVMLKGATNMASLLMEIQLTDIDLNDGVRAGMTALPNAAVDANNGLVTGDGSVTFTAGVGNRPSVDTTALGGTVQSATDLKDFADAGYDPATNKVQGVVLTDTLTTYTGNTVQTGDSFARLAAPAGASVSADIAAVKSDTAAILTDTGTSGVALLSDTQTSIDAIETDTSTTLQAELDAIQAAVITNAAGVDIAADIIAVKSETAAILVDTGTTLQAELDAIQAAVITNAAGVDIAADIIALKAETASILTDTGTTIPGTITTVDTVVDGIQTDLSNATDGLGALKTLIDTVNTDLSNGTDGLGAIKADTAAIKLKTDNQPEGIQKNATLSNFEVLMVDSTDHVTPKTGLTVTGQRSVDGGAFANVAGTIAEVGSGIYQFDALAADTNGDLITWKFNGGATADDAFVTFKTVT